MENVDSSEISDSSDNTYLVGTEEREEFQNGDVKIADDINPEVSDDDTEVLQDGVFINAVKRNDISRVQALLQERDHVVSEEEATSFPLHIAVERNTSEMAKLLLQHGAPINVHNSIGLTPLCLGIMFGDGEMVKLLMDSGANVNLRTSNSWSPLHFSTRNCDLASTVVLVEAGADVNCATEDRWSPLHFAAQYNERKITEFLVRSGADVNVRGYEGATALHLATLEAGAEMVELLMSLGADVLQQDDSDCNPLMHAAFQNDVEKMRILLKNRPKLDQVNNQGLHILHIAAIYGSLDMLNLLFDYGALDLISVPDENGLVAVTHAIISGATESVRLLLEYEEDMERTDKHGWTLFHHGVASGSCDKLAILMSKGCKDSIFPENYSPSPLHVAAANNFPEILQLLLDNGADIEIRDSREFTPLHTAVNLGKEDSAVVLICNGANIEATISTQQTPLLMAVANGDLKMTQILASNGANVNAQNADGESSLHIALKDCTSVMVHLLLSSGADTSVVDHVGNSVLHDAITHSTNDVIEVILEHGSYSLCDANVEGFTPLQLAVKSNCQLKVTTILKHILDQNEIKNALQLAMKLDCNREVLHLLDEAYLKCRPNSKWDLQDLILIYSSITTIQQEGNPLENRDDFDQTMLHYAALLGIDSHISLFIEHGADLFVEDCCGTSPFQILTQYPKQLFNILHEHTDKIDMEDLYAYLKWFQMVPSSDLVCLADATLESIEQWQAPHPESVPEKLTEWLCRNEVNSEEMLHEFNQIRADLETIMMAIAEKITLTSPEMASEAIFVGSIQEGTKCGFPDQFDVLFNLVELSTKCELNIPQQSLSLKDGQQTALCIFTDDTTIDVTKLNTEFQCTLTQILKDNQWLKSIIPKGYILPQHNQSSTLLPKINIIWRGQVLKHMNIRVSIRPSVEATLPLNIVRPFPLETEEDIKTLLVPASTDGTKADYFQIAVVTKESNFMQELAQDIRLGFILAKKLRLGCICPKLDVTGLGHPTEAKEYLSSHILKTCLLYELDDAVSDGEHIHPVEDEPEQSIPERILFWADRIYGRLEYFLEQGHVPSYHIPEYDILSCLHVSNAVQGKAAASKQTQTRHIMLAYCDIIRNKFING